MLCIEKMLYSWFNSVFSVGQHPSSLKLIALKCSLTSESRYSNDKEGIIYYLNAMPYVQKLKLASFSAR
jgi:hypothetical protein